ncbi:MAG TPA: CoA ester lyase [Streptosporangiaceae bacterium]|nr:CoA ester lyase [Streptosporangiaceae bacterium]
MTRLLPSMLYVPGGDKRKLAKLPALSVRAVILDLEDAVAVATKERARDAVAGLVSHQIAGPEIFVRVNSAPASHLYDDLHAVVAPGLSGVVLPKTTVAADVERVDWLIGILEARSGLPPGSIRLMPTIESVRGVENAADIAAASPRVQCLAFGAGDFSLDVGLDWPQPGGGVSPSVLQAKQELVFASRSAGVQAPHDGVYPLFRDLEGLRLETKQAASVGMFGKHAIHPSQVPVIDEVFRPGETRVRQAKEVLERFRVSEAAGTANIEVNGLFIDYPVAQRAEELLRLAEDLGDHS